MTEGSPSVSGADRSSAVWTVQGPVPPAELGFTLTHEHLSARLWEIPQAPAVAMGVHLGAIYLDEELIAEELANFKAIGGGTLVEVTLPAIGRDPDRYLRLSRRIGLHIVMGCGWYREPFYPPEDRIDRLSVDALAEVLVREIEEGVGPSKIRPGIIGEIGANGSWVSAQEERVHRAAARAQIATGLSLTTHSAYSAVGLAQLRIFAEEGVDLGRVAIGHCDSWPVLDYYLRILGEGSYVQMDNLGQWGIGASPSEVYESRVIDLIAKLVDRGYEKQLLLSHDAFNSSQYQAYGGGGFCYISDSVIPRLRDVGLTSDVIRTLTVENPARFLSGQSI